MIQITQSASISISQSLLINPLTSTMVAAGRISEKYSPCARAASSHWEISVKNIRVRITLPSDPPASRMADSIMLMHRLVWLYRSPGKAVCPSAAIGAVPETEIVWPILTALEKPIGFSKGDPEDMFCRCI
jgi:hypothetical protein